MLSRSAGETPCHSSSNAICRASELNRDIVTESTGEHGCRHQVAFIFLVWTRKSYCLYEAPDAEAIREAARRLNIPADTIIEIGNEFRPGCLAFRHSMLR
jgi:hypothetical protein